MILRDAKKEDGPAVYEWLQEKEILVWFPILPEKREIDDTHRIWMRFAVDERAGITAEVDGKVVGMAILNLNYYTKMKHHCLLSILVDKEYRGQGVGSALLKELEKVAKERHGLKMLHLEVYDGNPAIHLYQKHGYVQFGKQERFTKENGKYVGKNLMQKDL